MVDLVWSTNAYQASDLAPILPRATFTKHHRLVTATGIIRCYNEWWLCTVIDCG